MRFAAALAMVVLAGQAWAKNPDFGGKAPQPLPPAPHRVNAATVAEHGPFVQRVLVTVQMGKGRENPVWQMTHTASQVWLGKLAEAEPVAPVDPAVLRQVKSPSPSYKGLKVEMHLVDGRRFEPVTLYNGKVKGPGGATLRDDPGRGLEYWVFSTARVRRDLLLGPQVLPVVSFEQCRLLGMEIVATEPRQCLLPDKTILLQTAEKPTRASLRATDFDSCLKHGQGLINSFPRRCIAAGGRVFAEPPRVVETPADAPLAAGVSGTLQVPVGVSPSAAVSPVEVRNPLLGAYVVSGSAASATAVFVSGSTVSVTIPATSETYVPIAPSETLGVLLGGSVTAPVSSSAIISGSWIAPEVNPGAGPETWRAWTARKVEDLRLWLKAKGF